MTDSSSNQESKRPSDADAVDVVGLHAAPEREPVKLWVIVVIMALMFFGGMFLWSHSGGFEADIYDTNRLSWSGTSGGPAAAADPKILGKRIFSQNCAICHQPTGLGIPGQYPPLAGSEWVLAQEWHGDNHIVRIVLNGFTGSVTVKGQTFNNEMAPWGPVLKDNEIAAVLTYVRSEWGNQAPPISQEFVAKIREQTKDRNDRWTPKELQAIPRETSEAPPAASSPAPSPGASPAASQAPASSASPAPKA